MFLFEFSKVLSVGTGRRLHPNNSYQARYVPIVKELEYPAFAHEALRGLKREHESGRIQNIGAY